MLFVFSVLCFVFCVVGFELMLSAFTFYEEM